MILYYLSRLIFSYPRLLNYHVLYLLIGLHMLEIATNRGCRGYRSIVVQFGCGCIYSNGHMLSIIFLKKRGGGGGI